MACLQGSLLTPEKCADRANLLCRDSEGRLMLIQCRWTFGTCLQRRNNRSRRFRLHNRNVYGRPQLKKKDLLPGGVLAPVLEKLGSDML